MFLKKKCEAFRIRTLLNSYVGIKLIIISKSSILIIHRAQTPDAHFPNYLCAFRKEK